jgi:hypothetical protein
MNSVVLQVIQSGNLLEISFKMSNYTIPKKNYLQQLGEKNEFSKITTYAWEIKRPFTLSHRGPIPKAL